ncbi:hypothetical protein [Streptomyces sp. NPDC085540]|uniref:hypothetical protein n=1 Tax=Streptomyces sp. NPDC085540 TaxID=3365730 RepID=UPI0037D749CD
MPEAAAMMAGEALADGKDQTGGPAGGHRGRQQPERRHVPDGGETEEVQADDQAEPGHRGLRGVEHEVDDEETGYRAPLARASGLRADRVRDFRLEVITLLCRAPGDAVLTCSRDLDVLDEPLEARIGIASDVALLVQGGTVVGWSPTDRARYLTTTFVPPDPGSPTTATRRLFTACLDLVTSPLIDEVTDRESAALARLRAVDEALRNPPRTGTGSTPRPR